MIVRTMTKEDIDTVMEIESSLYTDKWTKKAYLEDLDNSLSYNYVLEHNGVILGYYGFWLLFDTMDITKVSIRKEFQGKGLANILMEDLIKRSDCFDDVIKISLEVRESNFRAINLYSKHGFKKISIRKKYYEDIEDAIIMQKEVKVDA